MVKIFELLFPQSSTLRPLVWTFSSTIKLETPICKTATKSRNAHRQLQPDQKHNLSSDSCMVSFTDIIQLIERQLGYVHIEVKMASGYNSSTVFSVRY